MEMQVRGIRGAITIDEDNKSQVLDATQELLTAMQAANGFLPEDIASVLFTVTPDVRSAFPAEAARLMGWEQVPLLCFQEIEVPGALPRCIRVLIHINTDKPQESIKHIYLGQARSLRPDLSD
ncbi:MAG: chorismate mutase [Syntrophomonadaceae bacterium]|nr:chorismate mutase [Syntrophomonadaceae bacterium]